MKAVVKEKYGTGNVTIKEVSKPQIKDDEVLIKVHFAGICGTDLHILLDDSYPVNPPVTLGHELSGEILVSSVNPEERISAKNGFPLEAE